MGEKEENSKSESELFIKLENAVNDLYKFRDYYFETRDLTYAKQKASDVNKLMQDVISLFEQNEKEALSEDRAKYYYLLGKAYNIETNYNPKAEELLSKAVKLNPNIVDAWNHLGESFYKNHNMIESKNCFENAVSKERNKFSLRYLSYFARNRDSELNERIRFGLEGIKFAKEAVELDPADGESWGILGNAYMIHYLTASQSPSILQAAMEAYQRAQEHVVSNSAADLHYNRATMLKYIEEYRKALEALERAIALEPWWDGVRIYYENLTKYLNQTQYLVHQKGRMKPKKLNILMNELSLKEEKYLGRYKEGFKTERGTLSLSCVPFSQLKIGKNIDKVVIGAVVCSVYNDNDVPFTFCVVDKEGSCFVVTVYNLAAGVGVIIGDIVAIPFPQLSHINFAYKGKIFDFKVIRVDTPKLLTVNGKNFKPNNVSPLQVSCTT